MESLRPGLHLRPHLMAAGFTDREVRAMRRRGALDTVRPGAYVAGSVGEDPAARHLFAVRAAVAQLGAGAVVSHTSAAKVHGFPLWRGPLDRVHATRDRRSGARRSSLVHLHAAALEPDEVTSVGGVLVTSVARTLVDVARLLPFGPALVPTDAALHRTLTTAYEGEAVERSAHRRRNSAARRVVAFADGRSESPGETLSRVAIHDAGLPAPVLQREVRSGEGRVLGRCDFFWEEFAVVGEFDGRVKYGRGLQPGQDPETSSSRRSSARTRSARSASAWCAGSGPTSPGSHPWPSGSAGAGRPGDSLRRTGALLAGPAAPATSTGGLRGPGLNRDGGRSLPWDFRTLSSRHAWSSPVVSKLTSTSIETIVGLAKRRGFVFASGEIYGGTRSAWDYGPLGVELKENIKRQWWRFMVTGRDDVVGLDSSVILPRQVWEASGHVEVFTDPLVECLSCHRRFRADQLAEEFVERTGKDVPEGDLSGVPCPHCGTRGQYTEPRAFSGLMKTFLGPVDSEEGMAYLRPETAQGIFVNFLNVQTTSRKKPPFGIGQMGKSFRNEITPGNFIFRTREFEQMEMEYFVEPGTDEELHQYWIDERTRWYTDLGIARENLRYYEHPKEKLSHYSKRTVDVEYRFGFSGQEWGELEGIANRTDFDLTTHSNHSGVDLSFYDQASGTRYRPYVIEPAAGVGRSLMAFLIEAYTEDEAPNAKGGVDKRVVLRLDRRLAPVKAAVLPLSRNADLSPKARDLAAQLRRNWNIEFDDAGAIGRRYRRQDEIGTPFCITVDFDTLTDQAVTIRERDSMAQERVALDQVEGYLAARLIGC